MPPRNNPVPNAVRLFNCAICDKGYPRQVDYENHLRSYDHNHRQRLSDMKKLTASNDPESSKPKASMDMRSINVEEANKKPGIGGPGKFTKIGGGGGAAAGVSGGRFKKVGVAVGGGKEDEGKRGDATAVPEAALAKVEVMVDKTEAMKDEDAEMADDEQEEAITWEEYDFTKPTGCDHASCPGCNTDGIWSGEWIAV